MAGETGSHLALAAPRSRAVAALAFADHILRQLHNTTGAATQALAARGVFKYVRGSYLRHAPRDVTGEWKMLSRAPEARSTAASVATAIPGDAHTPGSTELHSPFV